MITVTYTSDLGGPILFDDTKGGGIAPLIHPRYDIHLEQNGLTVDYSIAPYGQPNPGRIWVLGILAIIVLLFLGVLRK